MNISKYIGKTFPSGKTAKELGIDTSRKFVVVEDWGCSKIKKGDTLTLQRTDGNSKGAYFTRLRTGKTYFFPFYCLAYLEEEECSQKEDTQLLGYDIHEEGTTQVWGTNKNGNIQVEKVIHGIPYPTVKPYVPRVGDKVAMNGEVVKPFDENGVASVRFVTGHGGSLTMQVDAKALKTFTLISRPPRTLAKAEAEKMLSEKLGEEITIE